MGSPSLFSLESKSMLRVAGGASRAARLSAGPMAPTEPWAGVPAWAALRGSVRTVGRRQTRWCGLGRARRAPGSLGAPLWATGEESGGKGGAPKNSYLQIKVTF